MRDQMQEIFGSLFDSVFTEAVTSFTGTYMGPGDYDPVTETTTAKPVVYGGRGVFYDYTAERYPALNILVGDVRLLVLANETEQLPKVGHKINTKDVVGILGVPAVDYRVVTVMGDPEGVHFDLQLRAS